MSERNFDSLSVSWDQEPRRQRLAEDIAAGVMELVPLTMEMHLLDYGCGTGLVAMHLLPHVGRLTGLDSSAGMLSVFAGKLGRDERQRVRLAVLDLAAGGSADGTYDVILAAMLLHHVRDPAALITELGSHLAPGGYLCLADLDSEDGSFHDDPTGIFHHGFDRAVVAEWQRGAGLLPQAAMTVSVIDKGSRPGAGRSYPVFLSVAVLP
jgi:SAM-dependent methyltransferase